MALILKQKIMKINKNSRVQKETECTYNVFNANERKYIQFDTYGTSERKSESKSNSPFLPLRQGEIPTLSRSFLYKQLLLRNGRAVSLFWFIPSHGQVFLLGLEHLLQAFRLKIVYTL